MLTINDVALTRMSDIEDNIMTLDSTPETNSFSNEPTKPRYLQRKQKGPVRFIVSALQETRHEDEFTVSKAWRFHQEKERKRALTSKVDTLQGTGYYGRARTNGENIVV